MYGALIAGAWLVIPVRGDAGVNVDVGVDARAAAGGDGFSESRVLLRGEEIIAGCEIFAFAAVSQSSRQIVASPLPNQLSTSRATPKTTLVMDSDRRTCQPPYPVFVKSSPDPYSPLRRYPWSKGRSNAVLLPPTTGSSGRTPPNHQHSFSKRLSFDPNPELPSTKGDLAMGLE